MKWKKKMTEASFAEKMFDTKAIDDYFHQFPVDPKHQRKLETTTDFDADDKGVLSFPHIFMFGRAYGTIWSSSARSTLPFAQSVALVSSKGQASLDLPGFVQSLNI
jgi:hypothetical protein